MTRIQQLDLLNEVIISHDDDDDDGGKLWFTIITVRRQTKDKRVEWRITARLTRRSKSTAS
jgi:hypothetical protein